MTHLTKSEFAARRGWSKSYVSKLAAQDRLVLTDHGKVDVEATEALLAESADPSKAAVTARHEENRVERDVRSLLQPGGDTPAVQPLVQQPGKGPDFQKARAHREFYLAQLAEAEFHKLQGSLVGRKRVEDAAYTAGRTLRDMMFGVIPQLSAELAGTNDPRVIEKLLAAAIRLVFENAAKISDADLEHAMTQS